MTACTGCTARTAAGACAGINMRKLFSNENFQALMLCLILVALTIFTAALSPTWIYAGF